MNRFAVFIKNRNFTFAINPWFTDSMRCEVSHKKDSIVRRRGKKSANPGGNGLNAGTYGVIP